MYNRMLLVLAWVGQSIWNLQNQPSIATPCIVCTMKWCVIFMFFFLSNIVTCIASVYLAHEGSFNKYVDKMRWGEGVKKSVFVHAQGIKTVHAGGGGSKNGKILST